MKKWQKIAGIIIFFLITLYELLTWANTYVYLKYVVEPTDNDLLIEQSYIYQWIVFWDVDEFSVSHILIHMFMVERR